MPNKLRDVFFPTEEQVEKWRKAAEEARARYKLMIETTPEHEGANDRMRSCPNSYGDECGGELFWLCSLAPGFCTWTCALYDRDACRFEGVEHQGSVVGLPCLSHECPECPMNGVTCHFL